MRKLLACLLTLFLLASSTLSATNWSSTVRKVEASIVRLSHPVKMFNIFNGEVVEKPTACTGFVINKKQGYVMTAHHCLNEGTTTRLTVAGATGPVWMVFEDEDMDIAVIGTLINKPALKPSRVYPQKGQEIGSLGFGYGLSQSLFRAGYVSNVAVVFNEEIQGTWALFDGPFIGGMSGGPIFNHKGEVVGIVQMSNEVAGLWRPFSRVFAATRAFWG